MVSLNGAYSKKYQLQAQESLAQYKDRNQDEEKEKIKILSRQTNEMRRKLERKKKTKEEKEEERRKSILENRRLKQQIATEKFQHSTEPAKQKHVRSASVGTLKDGQYDVAGYLIDIKNGVRVNSTLISSANPIHTKVRHATQSINLHQPATPSNNYNPPGTQSKISNLPSTQSNIFNPPATQGNILHSPSVQSNILTLPFSQSNIRNSAGFQGYNYNLPSTQSNNLNLPSTQTNNYNQPSTQSNNFNLPSTQNSNLNLPSTQTNNYNQPSTQSNNFNLPSTHSNNFNLPFTQSNNFSLTEYLSTSNVNKIVKNQSNQFCDKNAPVTSRKTMINEGDSSSSESVLSNDSLNKNNKYSKSSNMFSENVNGLTNNIVDVLPYTTEQLLEQMQCNMLSTINEITGEDSSLFNKTASSRVNNVAIVSPRVFEKDKIVKENAYAKRLSNSSVGLSLKDSLDTLNNHAINKEATKYIYSTAAVNQEVAKHIYSTVAENQETFKRGAAIKNSAKNTEEFKHSAVINSKPINPEALYEQPFHEKNNEKKDALSESSNLNHLSTSYNQSLFLKSSINIPTVCSVPNVPTVCSSSSNHILSQYSRGINSSITSVSKTSGSSFTISNVSSSSKPSAVSETSIYSANRVNLFDYSKKIIPSDSLESKQLACNVAQHSERKNSFSQQPHGSLDFPNTMNKNRKNSDSVSEEASDEIFKQAQQSFAELTFPKTKNENTLYPIDEYLKDTKVNIDEYSKDTKVNIGNLDNYVVKCDINYNENKVPQRYDSNNLKHGRLIVSADSKKKINTDFTPHPPSKPKNAIDFVLPSTHHHAVSQNSNSILNCNEQTYSWNTPCEKGYSVKPFEFNQLNYNNSFGKHTRSISSGSTNNKTEQKSKVTFSNEQMSISQSSGNHIVNSQNRKKIIALNKTPTDDEINNLWENVRQCLSAESSGRQAHSDIVPVSQNSHQSPRNYNNGQFYRSLSASSYRRNSFLENSTKQHNFFNQNNKGFIGVKNTNTMGVNMGVRSTNTTSIASRQSLLPQRAVQMIRNPKMTNKYDLNHNVDNLQNNALSSTASFLALEELCKNESLTPKQTDVFFHPSMQFKKKISNVDLSYEERCVMASLDRINKKLQEKEKVMGLYK